MAGIAQKLRGPAKGAKLRDTRTAVKALVGAGCPIEDVEIEVTSKSALVRVKQGAGERKENGCFRNGLLPFVGDLRLVSVTEGIR